MSIVRTKSFEDTDDNESGGDSIYGYLSGLWHQDSELQGEESEDEESGDEESEGSQSPSSDTMPEPDTQQQRERKSEQDRDPYEGDSNWDWPDERGERNDSSSDGIPGSSDGRMPSSDQPFGGGALCQGCMAMAEVSGDERELYCGRVFGGDRHLYTSCMISANQSETAFKGFCRWAVCTPEQAKGG